MTTAVRLAHVSIVLQRPRYPENIGAAARAMKNMNLEHLYLVAPRSYPHPEARVRASGADDILDAAALPIRMTAQTQCFRSEAGSAGKDTAGMLRQHQFEKVEMVSITAPDQSEDEHARMTRCAEDILERLGLARRGMELGHGKRRRVRRLRAAVAGGQDPGTQQRIRDRAG